MRYRHVPCGIVAVISVCRCLVVRPVCLSFKDHCSKAFKEGEEREETCRPTCILMMLRHRNTSRVTLPDPSQSVASGQKSDDVLSCDWKKIHCLKLFFSSLLVSDSSTKHFLEFFFCVCVCSLPPLVFHFALTRASQRPTGSAVHVMSSCTRLFPSSDFKSAKNMHLKLFIFFP